MKLGNNFKSILQDERGRLSHKRVIALALSLALVITLITSSFIQIKIQTELISAIEVIIISAIGATAVDKFTNPVTHTNPENSEEESNGN